MILWLDVKYKLIIHLTYVRIDKSQHGIVVGYS
jgi:hypothetical protein